MSNKIAMYEGYGYKRKSSSKRRGGASAQKRRFAAAAKSCKGQSLKAFQACMRRKLKA